MDLDPERIARSPFVVGALGALVTAVKFTPGASWIERSFNVVAGSLAAGYVAPALIAWLSLRDEPYASGAAFVVGLLGMSVASAVVQAIRETPFGVILSGWLSRNNRG